MFSFNCFNISGVFTQVLEVHGSEQDRHGAYTHEI